MPEYRMKIAPDAVAYADEENHKLVVEFAIPGAPTETIDLKILEDSIHLAAPARDIEYVAALALGWPVKPDKAEATYDHGLLRIEVPLKDPMEDAVKIAIKTGGAETKTKTIAAGGTLPALRSAVASHRLANRPNRHEPRRGKSFRKPYPPTPLCAYQKWEAAGKPVGDGVQFLDGSGTKVGATGPRRAKRL